MATSPSRLIKNTPKKEKPEPRDPSNIDIEWTGKRFVLPEGMDFDEAIEALIKKRDEEDTAVSITEKIRAFPLDGAVAFQLALKEEFGWRTLSPTPGFFGDNPPTLVGVEIAHNKTMQVPWGRCEVPKIDGWMSTGFAQENGLPIFNLVAEVKRKDEKKVHRIAQRTREIILEKSIYKGQAIKLSFRGEDGELKPFNPAFCPKFLDIASFDETEVVYSQETERDIKINIFNPIEHTDACRKYGIPLKRGVILEGPFGTGKTLTAYNTAKRCVHHGWTFLLLEDVRDLHLAIEFAKLYEPCCVFAEDVDRAVGSSRSDEVNRIFNTIDGVESKNREIMVILTTNRIDVINAGFVRPGRIDAIVHVDVPDAGATVRLIRRYGTGENGVNLISPTTKDDQIVEGMKTLKGANSAFIREVVERSKLAAIGNANTNGNLQISGDDIAAAAGSMKRHFHFVHPEAGKQSEMDINPIQLAGEMIMEGFTQRFAHQFIMKLTNPKSLEKLFAGMKPQNQSIA